MNIQKRKGMGMQKRNRMNIQKEKKDEYAEKDE